MNDREKWAEQLIKSPNPFTKSIVHSAWEEFPDVPTINKDITDTVLSMLNSVKEGHYTSSLLVHGQPGVGKSHFIARLRRLANEDNYLFVAVNPISDMTNIFNHIYREIFTSLRKKTNDQTLTPMNSLISSILTKTLIYWINQKTTPEKRSRKIQNLLEQMESDHTIILRLLDKDESALRLFQSMSEKAIELIEVEYPEVDLQLLKVLFKYLDPSFRALSIRWLQGDVISDEDVQLLGVIAPIENDDIAQRILKSIMILSDRPILLCFDQLESIYDRFGDTSVLVSFFDTIVRLCNETPNALILLMVQSTVWDNNIEPYVQQSAQDRIERTERLQTPTIEQMVEMVEKRMGSVWGLFAYPPPYLSYPFTPAFIEELGHEHGWNPRYVLRKLAVEYRRMKESKDVREYTADTVVLPDTGSLPAAGTLVSVDHFLESHLQSLVGQFSDDPEENPFSSREIYLEAGIFDLFNALVKTECPIYDHHVKKVEFKRRDKELDIMVTVRVPNGGEEVWAVEICNVENDNSLRAVLRKIERSLDQGNVVRWFMIRDQQLELKPTWKKTIQFVDRLEEHGKLLYIDTEANAEVKACKELLDAASAGDLEVGMQILSRKDIFPYLVKEILPQIDFVRVMFGADISTSTPQQEPSPTSSSLPPQSPPLTGVLGSEGLSKTLLGAVEKTLIVSLAKILPNYQEDHHNIEQAVRFLVNEGKIILISQDETTMVIAKSTEEDVF